MKRYVIEREISGVGSLTQEQLKGAAQTSNSALNELGGKVQWVESFVAADKTFCIYLADHESSVHEHARLSEFAHGGLARGLEDLPGNRLVVDQPALSVGGRLTRPLQTLRASG